MTPRMMPGYEPYTPGELERLYALVAAASAASVGENDEPRSCPDCIGKHPDYRSAFGHLTMDPTTGATILEQHRAPRVMVLVIDGRCATCDRPPADHDTRYDLPYQPSYCLL